MLIINIPSTELYDEEHNEFITTEETRLELEHSLISLSKWESKWKKPFINSNDKTTEETFDYIRCMLLDENQIDKIKYLTPKDISAINDYISDPMTATTFYEETTNTSKKEVITSELIYYWMVASNIPMECEKWHLNRLLTLIRICSIKNTPPKKMSKRDIMSRNRALNEARRKQLHTNG